ncbi:MAG: hypothetical protein F6K10_18900 [Moorea sp. SIO2B7]|nr:hypothetical protein [Moorena sp. SIO2B7]
MHLTDLTLTEVRQKLRQNEVTSVALTEQLIERIKTVATGHPTPLG